MEASDIKHFSLVFPVKPENSPEPDIDAEGEEKGGRRESVMR